MDPAQRRLAERRLLAALLRLHRRNPLRADLRVDAVIAELRADAGERLPASHRGGGTLREVRDAELIALVDELATTGQLVRDGHRIRLPQHEPVIADPQMRERVERLLAGLRETGAQPPRVEAVASRLGVPAPIIDQLRAAGELVTVGEGIDYPHDVLDELLARMAELGAHGQLSLPRVRDGLRTSRRHAQALMRFRRTTAGPTRQRRCPISRG